MEEDSEEPVTQLADQLCWTVFQNNKLDAKDLEERNLLVEKLQSFLLNFWPDIKLDLYGSMRTGLALKTSDIDLALTFADNPGALNDNKVANYVRLVAKRLQCMPGIQVNTVLDKNRVPLIKLSETKTKIDVDISLHKSQSVKTSQMLKVYCALDERALILGCMLKKLTKALDIATTVGCHLSIVGHDLSQYAYVLTMIYFLQRTSPPVLPVLEELGYEGKMEEEDLAEKIRAEWSGYGLNDKSVGGLWHEFLDFYTEGLLTEKFDAEESVVCISQAESLSKAEVGWDYSSGLAIQDPGDLDSNIGAIPLLNYLKMKTVFVQAKNSLEEAMEKGREDLPENYFEWISISVHKDFSKPNYERSRVDIHGAVSSSLEFRPRVRGFANCGHPVEVCEKDKCRWGPELSRNEDLRPTNWEDYKKSIALPSAFRGKHVLAEPQNSKPVKNHVRKKRSKPNSWAEVMPTFNLRNEWPELGRPVGKDLRNNNVAAENREVKVKSVATNWREFKEVSNLNKSLTKCDMNGKESAKTWRKFKEVVDLNKELDQNEFGNRDNSKAAEQCVRIKQASSINKPKKSNSRTIITRASLDKDNFDKLLKENKIYYC